MFFNTPEYVATPDEAVLALQKAEPEIVGLQMNPGDSWSLARGLRRLHPPPDWSRRMEQIEAMSLEARGRVAEYHASEAPAPSDLFDRFRAHFDGLLAADPAACKRIGIAVWWAVTGPAGGDWSIDFRRTSDWVRPDVPEDWHLRITIPDRLVYLGATQQAIWDNLVLSFRIRLARRPDRYMKEFWTWFSRL